ncbi:MAG TPA: 23S rRNA (guanosine(2251)-2'-O)-methyltransferase RlmB [Candidatus Binataceae bacterium]|nr:23S rRNA (guanosine(2251)-2'-O)-methyltransferase RlmB [Candidatus Binataceae bacterium]
MKETRHHDRRGFSRRPHSSEPSHNRERREVVFGIEPIRELLAAEPDLIQSLYVSEQLQHRFAAEIDRAQKAGASVTAVDDAALVRMAGAQTRHQGMVALIREYRYASVEDLIAAAPDPLIVIDGVTDPRNLGAIFRSAECAGASALVLGRDRTVGVTPAAIKTSAGAWAHLRIARCGNVVSTLEMLKEKGYWVAALDPGGDTSLYELDVARRLALVVGAEDTGVRQLVKRKADFLVKIPMLGKVNSLNVSVATAVALFEIARRRSRL